MQTVTLVLGAAIAWLAAIAWCARAARIPEATAWLVSSVVATLLLRAVGIDVWRWVEVGRPYLLDVLLPLIVFQTTFCLDFRNRRHLWPAGLLVAGAFVITIASAAAIFDVFVVEAYGVAWIIGVIAAMVMLPTDATPVAPGLRLRSPRGLRMLIRNELPFGAALTVVGVTIALPHVAADAVSPAWTTLLMDFSAQVAIGGTVGAALAALAAWPLRRLASGSIMHWASVAIAIFAFHGAQSLGGAGIVAVLAAGAVLGREAAAQVALNLWKPIGRAASGLLILALGVAMCSLDFAFFAPVLIPTVIAMILGRLISVAIVEKATHAWVKLGISGREIVLISALGVRGAPTIALALALPDSMPYVDTIRTVAFIVIAFDLLIIAPMAPRIAMRFANHAPIPSLMPRRIAYPY